MPIDASIYNALGVRPKPMLDYSNDLNTLDANKLQLQQGQIGVQNALQAQREAAGVRDAAKSFGADANANYNALLQVSPTAAATYLKSRQEFDKTQSDIGLNKSHAANFDSEVQGRNLDQTIKKHDFAVQQLGAVTTPAEALAWATKAHQDGVFPGGDDQYMQGVQKILQASQSPEAFQQWKQGALAGGTTATEQLKLAQAAKLASEQNATSVANNTATNKTHLAGIGIQQAGENQRAKLSREAQFKVAGLDANGNFSGGDGAFAGLVDSLGKMQVNPAVALQRVPPGVKSQVLAEVQAKYPGWSDQDYAVSLKASKDFGTGKQGQEAQSANTGLNHLETLQRLAAAQKNGDVQLFNKIANEWGAQTGKTAPTDFKAAVTLVAPEISKAVVGAGGGVEDRAKAAGALNPNYSPDQFLSASNTMKELFAGRLSEAERTYARTTKRHDFRDTMLSPAARAVMDAKMPAAAPATAHPQDIQTLLDKYGNGK